MLAAAATAPNRLCSAPVRVSAALAPSRCVPPSTVLMLFTKPMIVSLQVAQKGRKRGGVHVWESASNVCWVRVMPMKCRAAVVEPEAG